MNALVNTVQLIGRLGQDPQVKQTAKGRHYTRFSIATNEVYRTAEGEKRENTQWHDIVAWGTKAETIGKYLKKGGRVAIQGKLTNSSWEDKAGNKRYSTEVTLNEFMMLDSRSSAPATTTPAEKVAMPF